MFRACVRGLSSCSRRSSSASAGARANAIVETSDGVAHRRDVSTTSRASFAASDGDERLNRRAFDSQELGEIKPDLVKKYLSQTNLSRGDINRRAMANERAAFARSQHDTGSSEVQIASLTQRIKFMTEHLSIHKKDAHSRHGLMAMLERRKKLLKYLRRTDGDRYADTILRLGLKDRSFVDDKYAQ